MKPICYLRMRDGKPDWAEDCVSGDDHSLRGTYPPEEGYSVIPLYAHETMPGWQMVPIEPTVDMQIAGQEAVALCYRTKEAMEDCEHAKSAYKAMLRAALMERVVERPTECPAKYSSEPKP